MMSAGAEEKGPTDEMIHWPHFHGSSPQAVQTDYRGKLWQL